MISVENKYNKIWDQIDPRLTMAPGFSRAFGMFKHGHSSTEKPGMYVAHLSSCMSQEDPLALASTYGLQPEKWYGGQVLIDIGGLRPLIGNELVDELIRVKTEEETARAQQFAGLDMAALLKRAPRDRKNQVYRIEDYR